MLDRLGVGELLDHRVATLSGGQARRVEIARALLHRPALLLCDEAPVGLDVKARQDIVAYLHDATAPVRLGGAAGEAQNQARRDHLATAGGGNPLGYGTHELFSRFVKMM